MMTSVATGEMIIAVAVDGAGTTAEVQGEAVDTNLVEDTDSTPAVVMDVVEDEAGTMATAAADVVVMAAVGGTNEHDEYTQERKMITVRMSCIATMTNNMVWI